MRVVPANVKTVIESLSNGDGNGNGNGNGNENSKKAIGLGPVYMEVGDPR